MKHLVRKLFRSCGFDLVRCNGQAEPPRRVGETPALPPDLDAQDRLILEQIAAFTMTSVERQIALIQAVRYLVRRRVPGCFVECGVWRGGSSMTAALTLMHEGELTRDLFLFDTFDGMPPPSEDDRTTDGTSAQAHLDRDSAENGVGVGGGDPR